MPNGACIKDVTALFRTSHLKVTQNPVNSLCLILSFLKMIKIIANFVA